MFIKRAVNPLEVLGNSSSFLFGARATGKSLVIRENMNDDFQYLNLLDSQLYLRLSREPFALQSIIDKKKVIIDEVQRIPELLNEVHRLIEEKGIRFLLTGSSARKLKHSNANLLAGRALHRELFPLTWSELEAKNLFSLEKYLRFGGLPHIWSSEVDPAEYLTSYVKYYLDTEIQRETQLRDLSAFHRFLKFGSLTSSHVLNFSKLSDDAQVASHTVREYYRILEDTLVGYLLPAFTLTSKRKSTQKAKFYLFDVGVKHAAISLQNLERNSDLYGQAFEHFIINECRAYLSYSRSKIGISYWRSMQQDEVDLIFGRGEVAVEIKAATHVSHRDHKALLKFKQEGLTKRSILVSQDPIALRDADGVEHMPYTEFLKRLWQGEWTTNDG